MLHYGGGGWNVVDSPTTALLYGVWGSGPDDVFAVGGGGTVLHYDGQRWTPMRSDSSAILYAVWGPSARETFVVGSNGTIVRWIQ